MKQHGCTRHQDRKTTGSRIQTEFSTKMQREVGRASAAEGFSPLERHLNRSWHLRPRLGPKLTHALEVWLESYVPIYDLGDGAPNHVVCGWMVVLCCASVVHGCSRQHAQQVRTNTTQTTTKSIISASRINSHSREEDGTVPLSLCESFPIAGMLCCAPASQTSRKIACPLLRR